MRQPCWWTRVRRVRSDNTRVHELWLVIPRRCDGTILFEVDVLGIHSCSNPLHGRLFYALSSVELLEVCFCNACVQAGLQHAYLAHVEVRVTATYVPQPEPEQPPYYGPWVCACLCPCLCLYLCLSMHMPNVFQNKHTALVSSTTLHCRCIVDSMANGESYRACRFLLDPMARGTFVGLTRSAITSMSRVLPCASCSILILLRVSHNNNLAFSCPQIGWWSCLCVVGSATPTMYPS